MNKLKKIFFALAVVVSLGLVGASNALAQVVFSVSSNTRSVRAEGTTEAIGQVVVTAQSAGTIKGGASGVGSTLAFDFGTAVYVDPAVTTNISGTVSGTAVGIGVCGGGVIVCTVSTNTFTIRFAADQAFLVGNTITLSSVRVNANKAASTTINSTVSGAVSAGFQATFPITFTGGTQVPVASVQPQAAASTLVDVTGNSTTSAPSSILLCNPTASPSKVLRVSTKENFAAAFLSQTDETALAGAPSTGVYNKFFLSYTLTGIPTGVTVVLSSGATSAGFDGPAGTIAGVKSTSVTQVLPATTTITSDTTNLGTVTFDVEISATNSLGSAETASVLFTFSVSSSNVSKLSSAGGLGTVTVALKAATAAGGTQADPNVPQFFANKQGEGNAVRTTVCATYLLFPWVVVTPAASGGYNTGIAIANTTKDPSVIGSTAQKGDVDLYFFNGDGTQPATSPVKMATALDAGKSVANTASALLGSGVTSFGGYVIAVCGFQLGHGFAYITNSYAPPGLQPQGYLAISITAPRLPGDLTVTESRGH